MEENLGENQEIAFRQLLEREFDPEKLEGKTPEEYAIELFNAHQEELGVDDRFDLDKHTIEVDNVTHKVRILEQYVREKTLPNPGQERGGEGQTQEQDPAELDVEAERDKLIKEASDSIKINNLVMQMLDIKTQLDDPELGLSEEQRQALEEQRAALHKEWSELNGREGDLGVEPNLALQKIVEDPEKRAALKADREAMKARLELENRINQLKIDMINRRRELDAQGFKGVDPESERMSREFDELLKLQREGDTKKVPEPEQKTGVEPEQKTDPEPENRGGGAGVGAIPPQDPDISVEELDKQIEEAGKKLDELQGQVEAAKAELEKLRAQIEELKAQRDSLKAEVDELGRKKAELTPEGDKKEGGKEEEGKDKKEEPKTEAQVAQVETDINDKKAKLAAITKAIADTQKLLDDLKQKIGASQKEIEDLQKELKDLTAQRDGLKLEIVDLMRKKAELEGKKGPEGPTKDPEKDPETDPAAPVGAGKKPEEEKDKPEEEGKDAPQDKSGKKKSQQFEVKGFWANLVLAVINMIRRITGNPDFGLETELRIGNRAAAQALGPAIQRGKEDFKRLQKEAKEAEKEAKKKAKEDKGKDEEEEIEEVDPEEVGGSAPAAPEGEKVVLTIPQLDFAFVAKRTREIGKAGAVSPLLEKVYKEQKESAERLPDDEVTDALYQAGGVYADVFSQRENLAINETANELRELAVKHGIAINDEEGHPKPLSEFFDKLTQVVKTVERPDDTRDNKEPQEDKEDNVL